MSMSFSPLKSLSVRIRDSVAVPIYWAISSREMDRSTGVLLVLTSAVKMANFA